MTSELHIKNDLMKSNLSLNSVGGICSILAYCRLGDNSSSPQVYYRRYAYIDIDLETQINQQSITDEHTLVLPLNEFDEDILPVAEVSVHDQLVL